jgi:hypothetical protein
MQLIATVVPDDAPIGGWLDERSRGVGVDTGSCTVICN